MQVQKMIYRSLFCLLAWAALAVAPTFAQTITQIPLFTFGGDSNTDRLGSTVSGAGDVNGDGFAGFFVGAPGGGPRKGEERTLVVSLTFSSAAPLSWAIAIKMAS